MDRVSASARGTIFPNVVLIGARASGKSRLARQLAEKVGWKRVSTDDRITARWGPIADLVARAGWDRFRELEAAVLAEISGRRLVVDCGGGIVERNENLRRLRALGTVYWVRAPAAVLRERLARPRQRITRPLFAGVSAANEAAAMLARRTPRYRDAATADVWNGEPRTAAPEDAANALFEAHFGPRLALSVAAPTVEAATAGLVQAAAELGPGDLIELRLDHLATPTPAAAAALLRPLSEALLRRLIVTVRPLSEGGRFPAGEEERSALLIESARLGPGWMDLEYEADRRSRGSLSRRIRAAAPGIRLLASVHHLRGFPEDLEALPRRMAATRPNRTKIAVAASAPIQVRRVHDLIRSEAAAGRELIGIALGARGKALRVIAGGAGAPVASYAPPSGLPVVAEGQLTATRLRSCHRRWGRKLRAPVPVFGVVGDPIGHSLSPPMHEAAFRHLGIEAAYLAFEVAPEELADFLSAARLSGAAGLNVTIPHKREVLALLEEVDEPAARIGAVNTILPLEGGGFRGENTDAIGAVRALEQETALTDRRITVIGAGGAARAVVQGVMRRGAEVVVTSRNDRKAAALAEDFGVGSLRFANLAHAAGDILVNCTPLGMDPWVGVSPAPASTVAGHGLVFDLVAHPPRTALLRTAARLGKVTIPGLRMLVFQAAAAFERWTGREAPADRMRGAAREAANAR